MNNHTWCKVAKLLVIVGAINWGLVGLGSFLGQDLNVVHMILGSWMVVENAVYVLVGVSGVLSLAKMGKCCKSC